MYEGINMASNKIYCPSCKEEKDYQLFFHSPTKKEGTFTIFCKSCCNKKFATLLETLSNEAAALWCLCAQLNVPFKNDIYARAIELREESKTKGGVTTGWVMAYINAYKEHGMDASGFWESDVMLDDLYKHKVVVDKDKLAIWKKKWGNFEREDGPDVEAYDFLDDSMKSYTQDVGDMDANLEKRYRDLCKAELALRRANEEGNMTSIKAAQDVLNKQLALLKLNDFQGKKSAEDLMLEKKIALLEYTEPAECEDLKAYLDMVGFEKDNKHDMRCLRNAIAGTRDYPDVPREER